MANRQNRGYVLVRRVAYLTALIVSLSSYAIAQELVKDFSDSSLPVLNEELRKLREYQTVRWDDQQVNISSVRLPAVDSPTWTAYKGSQVLAFDGTSTDTIYFTAQLTHKYKEGSDIDLHVHYVPEDGTAGNVKWQFTYSWANINDVFPTETTVTKIIPTTAVADKHSIKSVAVDMDGTGKKISSVLLCSLARLGGDAADTYDSKSIYLIALDFHILVDGQGSREETSK